MAWKVRMAVRIARHLLFAPRYGRDAMHVVVARRYGHAKGFYAVCMMYPPIN